MFARIYNELDTKTLSGALNAVIDDADNLLNKKKYFAAYDLYESVYRFLLDFNVENSYSNNIANELLWCKSAMEACKRLTSTIPSDEALANLAALELDLNTYALKLDKKINRTIKEVIKTAKAYYAAKRNCANANYLYALNVKDCLMTGSTNTNIVAIKKLVLLNTDNRVTISLIRNALKNLSTTYDAYQGEEQTAAIDLLATLNEKLADHIVNIFPPSEPRFVNYVIEYYTLAIKHWRSINIIPTETYFKILEVHVKIIELKPELATEQRNHIAHFIKVNFTEKLTLILPKNQLDKLDSFHEIAGINRGKKRTAEEAELTENIYATQEEIQATKKMKFDDTLKNKITAHHRLFTSKDNSGDSSYTTSEVSRPDSPFK